MIAAGRLWKALYSAAPCSSPPKQRVKLVASRRTSSESTYRQSSSNCWIPLVADCMFADDEFCIAWSTALSMDCAAEGVDAGVEYVTAAAEFAAVVEAVVVPAVVVEVAIGVVVPVVLVVVAVLAVVVVRVDEVLVVSVEGTADR